MQRFYVYPEDVKEKFLILNAVEAKHAFSVLRLKKNEKILVFDGKGKEYIGIIKSLAKKQGEIRIEKVIQHKPQKVKVTLAAAIPKQSKFEAIVDKATQLGVSRIIPLVTNRTIVKITNDKAEEKVKRWREIAVQTAKQCGCVFLPEITEIVNFETVLANTAGYNFKIIPCLSKNTISIKDLLEKQNAKDTVVFIGPEGDFDSREIALAEKAGAIAVSLGKNVLRCETAAVNVLSILNYIWGL